MNGKGDRNRTSDYKAYRNNYDAIFPSTKLVKNTGLPCDGESNPIICNSCDHLRKKDCNWFNKRTAEDCSAVGREKE